MIMITKTFAVQDIELLAAGFPCIDISRASKRAGLAGPVGHAPDAPSIAHLLVSGYAVAITLLFWQIANS